MKFFRANRNVAKQSSKSARPQRRQQSADLCAFEALEGRQLFSVTGFSLVNEASFPGTPTTVTSQPTIFQSTLQNSWKELVDGQMKINGQTLAQTVASGIQSAEHAQGLSAYDISSVFDGTPIYNGSLKETSSGSELVLTFDAVGNETTFTSTTNSILGSWADPTFHVTYNLNLTIDLSLPSNIVTGKVTASANVTTSDVTVKTSNVLVGLLGVFGDNIPQQIADGINGQQANISSIVPTGLLNTALQAEAAEGYTHLLSSLNSSGNLVLTAQKSSLTVNGSNNDTIKISSGSNGSVVVTAGGQTQTFAPGYLKSITVNDNGFGKNSVDIPSLPSSVAVQVNDDSISSDTVTVGGTGSLANVAGTVNVNNTASLTALTVDDLNDSGASNLKVTGSAVEFNGRNVITYSSEGYFASTTLMVESGAHGSNITVAGTASGVATTIQTGSGSDNYVAIDGSSSAITVYGFGGLVTVGGNGTLTSIHGTVDVSNFGTVDVENYYDDVSRKVDLTSTTSGIFTSSSVAFQGLSTVELGYVENVYVSDGNGDNSYYATGDPGMNFFTVYGHEGDTLSGPAAAEVAFNTPPFI